MVPPYVPAPGAEVATSQRKAIARLNVRFARKRALDSYPPSVCFAPLADIHALCVWEQFREAEVNQMGQRYCEPLAALLYKIAING